LADDLLMPQMYPIKHADGEANLAAAVAQLIRGMNNVHNFLATDFHR
jgi:hypothetical protein